MPEMNFNLSEENITEEEYEERRQDVLENEKDILAGILEAVNYNDTDTKVIQIKRGNKVFFSFTIHPLSEETINDIRKKYTKYVKNRRQGIKVAEELDVTKYRASMIYNSTIEADQKKVWDNERVWAALNSRGKVIVNALDVIECVLLPGEKDRIMDIIDDINGYNSEESPVDTAKN